MGPRSVRGFHPFGGLGASLDVALEMAIGAWLNLIIGERETTFTWRSELNRIQSRWLVRPPKASELESQAVRSGIDILSIVDFAEVLCGG